QFFQDPNSENIRLSVPVRGKSRGVEFDAQGQIYNSLSMIWTYVYTDTEVTEDPTDSANVGNRLPFAPRNQGSVWLKYDFTQGLLQGLSLGGGVYAAGRRFGDSANSYSDGDYASLDLMAAYKVTLGRSMLTTQLNINNVNDAEYFYLRSRGTNLPAEPLTVIGSIRLEF
ncbi:MAG: TonB-dependent receptor, partial [Deltaproteobacteria bacterium]|nr:TonB-dependent receptor [Deltaproteobacteria bacterium]